MSSMAEASILLRLNINSLDEFAAWVVARGKGIRVESPLELRRKVVSLATGVLENYQ